MFTCVCCNKSTDEHMSVSCCICKKRFIGSCVDLSKTEVRKINAKCGLTYTCKHCILLGDDINGLKSAIVSLQHELKQLKATPTTTLNDLTNSERIIQEIQNRDRRKDNIIVFGLPEECSNKNDQSSRDVDTVRDIFTTLQIDAPVVNSMRLGKYDSSRDVNIRPLRIKLGQSSSIGKIFRNISKLKSSNKYKHINISKDQTPMQIQLYKETKMELVRRSSAGEPNLCIKYLKGIPTIVKQNSANVDVSSNSEN